MRSEHKQVKNWDQDTGILSISQVGIGTTTTGSSKEKMSKDLHLVHCLVFLFTIRMIAPINITKVTYLSQLQTCLLTLQSQIHSGVFNHD